MKGYCRVQRQLPGVERTEVELHNLLLVCYPSSTTGCRQVVQISITTVVEVTSGKGHA